jgi:hypothetical protein
MIRYLRGPGAACLAVLAVVLLGAGQAAAQPTWIGFRNDTDLPVVVQGSSQINNVVRRGKPHLLYPGEAYMECIIYPGVKQFTIYDRKQPTRVLHQENVRCAGTDLFYAVELDDNPPPGTSSPPPTPVKGTAPPPPQLKLTPTKPPKPPAMPSRR